jgi:asparagine synthase (glutamine-hydrolysing)
MCGNNGTLAFTNGTHRVTPGDRADVDTMAHRGPDARTPGSPLTTVSVWLGGCRCRSAEAASQPMSNEDGTLWITYNGEIYNHAELRRELSQSGRHQWKTDHCDTEVILHAFEEWGIDCLSRFRGMFAFGLWDARARELWLVRDRIGIKPLYYSVHHGRLTFASEIKALLEDAGQHRGVDETALFHYLSFRRRRARRRSTASEAGARHVAAWADGTMTERRYWDVWDDVSDRQGEKTIAERVLAELRTAVSLRKMSDARRRVSPAG